MLGEDGRKLWSQTFPFLDHYISIKEESVSVCMCEQPHVPCQHIQHKLYVLCAQNNSCHEASSYNTGSLSIIINTRMTGISF